MNKLLFLQNILELNQKNLAEIMQVSQRSVSNYIQNESEPTFQSLSFLGRKYQINLNWFAGMENDIFLNRKFEPEKILENRIKTYKKEKFNDFQSQIIVIYRSILNAKINSREDIVTAIQNHDISSIIDKFVELYSNFRLDERKTKDECIEFIDELSEPEINYIVNHKDDFIEMLAKDKDIFNRVFKKLFY